jgi:hypothetical protein
LVAVTTDTDDGVAMPWIVWVVPLPEEPVPPVVPLPPVTPPTVLLLAEPDPPPQPASSPKSAATHTTPEIFLRI